MTIYKPNGASRKQEKKLVDPPEVVVSDKVPLAGQTLLLSRRRIITNAEVHRRRRFIKCAFIMVTMFMLLCMALVTATVYMRYYHHEEMFTGSCQLKVGGESFNERLSAGRDYEKLDVPPVFNFRRATVIHDFERNLTGIVDRDHGRCYIMPLNRDAVKPPKGFIDLLKKFQSGYYIPSAEIVHEKYRVETPEVEDVRVFGENIYNDCAYFSTYRLVKSQPNELSNIRTKRSLSCTMANNGFCLGTVTERMTCIEITDCVTAK